MGLGDLYGDYMRKKKELEAKKAEEEAAKAQAPVEEKPAVETDQIEEKKKVRKPRKPVDEKKDDDLKYVGYFYRPHIVAPLWKLELAEGDDKEALQKKMTSIAAAGQYSYCIRDNNEVYSWGFGENFVLGTLKDDNEYLPHCVNPKMYEERKVHQLALGT